MLPVWVGATVTLLLLIAFAYAQFRHIGLALSAALAPLPGFVIAAALHMPSPPLAYLCGFAIANILTSEIEARICDGASAMDAAKSATQTLYALLIGPLILAVCIAGVVPLLEFDPATLMLPLTVLLCAASAMIVAPAAARIFPFGEDFIARANRLREKRERWLDWLTFVVQPRWGWSVGGISLVFAVLGFFGAQNAAVGQSYSALTLLSAGAVYTVIGSMALRNIRRTIAFLLTVAVMGCLAWWIESRLGLGAMMVTPVLGLASIPGLMIAAQAAGFARAGDSVAVATLRCFEKLAVPVVFFCAALVAVFGITGGVADAMLVVCGGVAALVLLPALTTAIYDLLPPRVSLDAYRAR